MPKYRFFFHTPANSVVRFGPLGTTGYFKATEVTKLAAIRLLIYSRKILLVTENNNNLLVVLKAVFSWTTVKSTGRMEKSWDCTIPIFFTDFVTQKLTSYICFLSTSLYLYRFFSNNITLVFHLRVIFLLSFRYISCKRLSVCVFSQSSTYCLLRICNVKIISLQK